MSGLRRGREAQTRYDAETRERTLALADEHGAEEASRQTGIAAGTIRRWRSEAGRVQAPMNVDPDVWAARKRAAADETWEAAREALTRVRDLLERGDGRSERDAKDAALTLAILLDKSAALEQASAGAQERSAKLANGQTEAFAEALGGVLDDLGLPRSNEVRDVIAHRLRPLSESDAPRGPAPNAQAAARVLREELRAEVRDELERESREAAPLALPPGDHDESVQGEVVVGRFTPDDDDQDEPDADSGRGDRRHGPARIGY